MPFIYKLGAAVLEGKAILLPTGEPEDHLHSKPENHRLVEKNGARSIEYLLVDSYPYQ